MTTLPKAIDAIHDELFAKREAAALHEALNGLRSKLALEGGLGDPKPSDAAVMEAVEAGFERKQTARPERVAA